MTDNPATDIFADLKPGHAWYVAEWDSLYEVNSKGRPWATGQDKKARGLRFVRWHVFGPSNNNNAYLAAADYVADTYGENAWAIAFATFGKCLEIAAAQKRDSRGFLVVSREKPVTERQFQRISGFSREQVQFGMTVLTDENVGWIIQRPYHSREKGYNETETEHNVTEHNRTGTGTESRNSEVSPDPVSGSGSTSPQIPPSGPQPENGKLSPIVVAQRIALALNYSRRAKTTKQIQADNTTFRQMADRIVAGDLGSDCKAVAQACYDQAKQVAGKSGNTTARYVAWFKQQLHRFGHVWDYTPEQARSSGNGAPGNDRRGNDPGVGQGTKDRQIEDMGRFRPGKQPAQPGPGGGNG